MTDRTFKLSIGNPKNDDGLGITKSSEDNPLIGGFDSRIGSNYLFDNAGNIFETATKNVFRKGKNLFEELENSNLVIENTYTLNCLKIALSAIESMFVGTKDFSVNANSVSLVGDTTAQILSPTITLGKINSTIINGQSDGELYENNEQLYVENSTPDPLMTKRKFSKWWAKYMSEFIDEFNDLKNKYNALSSAFNGHKHGGVTTGGEFSAPVTGTSEQVTTAKAGKVKNLSNMQASKTTSAV